MKKQLFTLLTALSLYSSAQTIQLQPQFCGYTAKTFGEFIAADSVLTATNYQFLLVNTDSAYVDTFTNSSGYPYLALYSQPGMRYNMTFTVSVRWSGDNQATWSAFGPTCTITSPATATTQISSSYCGVTYTLLTNLIKCDLVSGCNNYEYKLENASLGYSQSFAKTNNNFTMAQFTGLQPATTYSASVRVKLLGIWNPYGPACPITTPFPIVTTSLEPAYCGITATSYSELLYAQPSAGSQFNYKLTDGVNTFTFTKTNNNFVLSQFVGLQNSTTYSVSVKVFYGTTWGPYGNACTVTTPSAAPTTSILPTECGTTATTFTQIFHCSVVTGATGYQYKMENVGLGYSEIFQKTNNNFNMHQFSSLGGGLQHNTAYNVSVSIQFNGLWQPFGPSCVLTTPSTGSRSPYPNPSVSHFTTETPIIIMDIYGKEIERIDSGDFGHIYPKGIYYIKSGSENYKLIKQ